MPTIHEFAALATLAEQGVVAALNLYRQIEANSGGTVKPLADVLADADATWASIQEKAKAEISANQ